MLLLLYWWCNQIKGFSVKKSKLILSRSSGGGSSIRQHKEITSVNWKTLSEEQMEDDDNNGNYQKETPRKELNELDPEPYDDTSGDLLSCHCLAIVLDFVSGAVT